jgi:hypothetical protein
MVMGDSTGSNTLDANVTAINTNTFTLTFIEGGTFPSFNMLIVVRAK